MACCCIKGHYDFDLQSVGKDQLKYTDLSDWMEQSPYVVLDWQTVFFKRQGDGAEKELTVQPQGTTVFKTKDLITGCNDGFYVFSVFGCYNCASGESGERKYTKTKAITPNAQCQLDFLMATEGENQQENLQEIQCLLDSVHANAELGKLKQAAALLDLVNAKLKKFDCKMCGC